MRARDRLAELLMRANNLTPAQYRDNNLTPAPWEIAESADGIEASTEVPIGDETWEITLRRVAQ